MKKRKPKKPRDYVTMREITHGTGTGPHRDKKREAKRGKIKHKGRVFPDPFLFGGTHAIA